MRYYEIPELEGNEFYTEVREKVIINMIKMLDKCEQEEKIVNWYDFKDYCMEYFTLPEITIDLCIPEARKKIKYKLAFN